MTLHSARTASTTRSMNRTSLGNSNSRTCASGRESRPPDICRNVTSASKGTGGSEAREGQVARLGDLEQRIQLGELEQRPQIVVERGQAQFPALLANPLGQGHQHP